MKTKLILFILALSCSYTFAQRKLADKFFENFSYIKATELYEEAVKKGDSFLVSRGKLSLLAAHKGVQLPVVGNGIVFCGRFFRHASSHRDANFYIFDIGD